MGKKRLLATHRKAIEYLTTPVARIDGEQPRGYSEWERPEAEQFLAELDPTERLMVDLEVAKCWYAQMQVQHSDLLARRDHFIKTAQASSIQAISLAMGISADKLVAAEKQISDLEARLGQGEVVEPARKIRTKDGKVVEMPKRSAKG